MDKKSLWLKYDEAGKNKIFEYGKQYEEFLSNCKTERECVAYIIEDAKKQGFMDLRECMEQGKKLSQGDKVYYSYMDKSLLLFTIGGEPIEKGLNILGAHIDSPRLDIKCVPLYEESGMAYLDTHYYGGIKKYQWVTLPLAVHGVVVKKDGSKVSITLGEKEEEPVVGITDLLPHLAGKQMAKKASDFIEGERLDILAGSIPMESEEKESVKENILHILKDTYGIEEEDFTSAELEVVPAGKARDFGLDSSMIMSYGHDDRVCAYPSYTALFNAKNSKKTCCCILTDKEEIGSEGATGMNSDFFVNALAELINCMEEYSDLKVKRALMNSCMISSDVTAAFDPIYPEVSDKRNCSYLGQGLAFCKFTGARGKHSSNDANPEFFARLRSILDEAGVDWQMTEMSKVDVGGGGTIAKFMARYGMQVIDSGVSVLSMHAPWEIVSKADVYEAYRGYHAFLLGC